jgi:hypothetical protein
MDLLACHEQVNVGFLLNDNVRVLEVFGPWIRDYSQGDALLGFQCVVVDQITQLSERLKRLKGSIVR